MMRIFLILLFLTGCTVHIEEEHVLCGYYETPYYETPYACDHQCCAWHVDDIYFYSECAEIWCYNEYACAWQLYDYSCYPI